MRCCELAYIIPPGGIPGAAAALLIRLLGHHALRREHQARDRGRVLQRGAHDLGRVDDAGLQQVLVLVGRRVEAEGALVVLDLVDDDRAFPAGVAGDPAGGSSSACG